MVTPAVPRKQQTEEGSALQESARLPQSKGEKGQEGNHPDDLALEAEMVKRYRSVAARCNYLPQDRPDLQFASKMGCTATAAPNWSHLAPEGDLPACVARSAGPHPRAGGQ